MKQRIWKHVDGPHWHRASVSPTYLDLDTNTYAPISEDDVEELTEISKSQYPTAHEAMSVIGIMTQWTGDYSRRWENWSLTATDLVDHGVELYSTVENQRIVYFPQHCDGCNSADEDAKEAPTPTPTPTKNKEHQCKSRFIPNTREVEVTSPTGRTITINAELLQGQLRWLVTRRNATTWQPVKLTTTEMSELVELAKAS